MSDVEDIIRDMKKISGFSSYLILNNDGIVIKHENMSLKTAVHFAYQIQSLSNKAHSTVKELLDEADNELETIRLRTNEYEMVIAQHGNYTLVVTQLPPQQKEKETEEKKETEEIKE